MIVSARIPGRCTADAIEVVGRKPGPRRTWVAVACCLMLGLLPFGCEKTTPNAAERRELETVIGGYLGALAESYSTMNLSPLDGYASPNEIAAVRKLLTQLAQTGDRIHSELLGFDVDGLEVFRDVNATARLIEVWDVTRFDAMTGEEKGRNPQSIQKTILQLRKVDGTWLVVGRMIIEPDLTQEQPDDGQAVEGGDTV